MLLKKRKENQSLFLNGCKKILFVLFFCLPFSFAKQIPEITLSLDLPLGIVSAGVAVSGSIVLKQTEIKELKDKDKLLPWDKPFAGTHSESADFASDILNGSLVFPFLISTVSFFKEDASRQEFLSILCMYTEALALQSGINLLVRSLQISPRPYLYSENADEEKIKGEAFGSFYSGHVSAAWTSAVFTSWTFKKLYPESKFIPVVNVASFGIAAAVGVLRVKAGKHYPTDVVVGALAGAGIALGVIQLHEWKSSKINLAVLPGYIGVVSDF